MSNDYSERLKDPRWQKKRLEIFERDKWQCQFCEDKDSTLVVHHKDYVKGKEPWDYPNSELDRGKIEQSIIHTLRGKFDANGLSILADAFEKMPGCNPSESWMIAGIIMWLLTTPDVMKEMDDRCWVLMNQGPK